MTASSSGQTPEKEVVTQKNTGSSEAQITIQSQRIGTIAEHLKLHKKDFAAKKSLLGLVSHRKRLLKYVHRKDPIGCKALCQRLAIRYSF